MGDTQQRTKRKTQRYESPARRLRLSAPVLSFNDRLLQVPIYNVQVNIKRNTNPKHAHTAQTTRTQALGSVKVSRTISPELCVAIRHGREGEEECARRGGHELTGGGVPARPTLQEEREG